MAMAIHRTTAWAKTARKKMPTQPMARASRLSSGRMTRPTSPTTRASPTIDPKPE